MRSTHAFVLTIFECAGGFVAQTNPTEDSWRMSVVVCIGHLFACLLFHCQHLLRPAAAAAWHTLSAALLPSKHGCAAAPTGIM
jgi:hypothetical protein